MRRAETLVYRAGGSAARPFESEEWRVESGEKIGGMSGADAEQGRRLRGVGSALGRLTPAIRLAPDRACGCRRCLHLALPGFAALNRGPTRQTPHHLVQRDFSGTLLVTKEEQPHGRQPYPASAPVCSLIVHYFCGNEQGVSGFSYFLQKNRARIVTAFARKTGGTGFFFVQTASCILPPHPV